jgi:hypothetical protein
MDLRLRGDDGGTRHYDTIKTARMWDVEAANNHDNY